MAIIGYARASTEDQKLDAQIEQLKEAKCERIYQEKVSCAKVDRPELVAMHDFVRDGDSIVVIKLGRIARSTKHLLEITDLLKKKKVAFKVLNINFDTSTPTGKLMQTMLAAVAEFEREMNANLRIVERMFVPERAVFATSLWERTVPGEVFSGGRSNRRGRCRRVETPGGVGRLPVARLSGRNSTS
jgi:hypothetical protein